MDRKQGHGVHELRFLDMVLWLDMGYLVYDGMMGGFSHAHSSYDSLYL